MCTKTEWQFLGPEYVISHIIENELVKEGQVSNEELMTAWVPVLQGKARKFESQAVIPAKIAAFYNRSTMVQNCLIISAAS